jgi:hypothetical protein
MTGTDLCVNKCKLSRSFLNHLVLPGTNASTTTSTTATTTNTNTNTNTNTAATTDTSVAERNLI